MIPGLPRILQKRSSSCVARCVQPGVGLEFLAQRLRDLRVALREVEGFGKARSSASGDGGGTPKALIFIHFWLGIFPEPSSCGGSSMTKETRFPQSFPCHGGTQIIQNYTMSIELGIPHFKIKKAAKYC